ncbi:MAG: uroporphyrinogen-III synthase [Gammaproteobacteria bacterium]
MLAGARVLVCRPAAQSQRLCEALRALGAEVRVLPTLAILPAADADAARRELAEVERSDLAVFTSANAVRHALELMPALPALLHGREVLAVGEATARALRDAGVAEVLVPDADASSTGLLAMPVLQAQGVRGRTVLIVTGLGGRDLLARELAVRGARVLAARLYRRALPGHTREEIDARIGRAPIGFVVATSAETLDNLGALLRAASRADVFDATPVLAARRLLVQARSAGFHRPAQIAASAHDADLVAALVNAATESRTDR